tara:strand:- start:36 stop:188 length:153 start_codon:yes stop_codon:yes gene_type:complete
MQGIINQVAVLAGAGVSLATLFYFTRIGNNVVSGVASWVATNASGITEGA